MLNDIVQQPAALRAVIDFYQSSDGLARLAAAPSGRAPILTGMGASYHAALAIVPYFHSLGVPAIAVEATDLLFYSQALLRDERPLIFISQSGASAEVAAIVEALPVRTALLARAGTRPVPHRCSDARPQSGRGSGALSLRR